MHIKNIRRWGLVALAGSALLAAFAFAACGGGDDDDDGGSSGDSGGAAQATGSDEKFVAAICKAGNDFSAALNKILTGVGSNPDEEKIAADMGDAYSDFANAFAKASPPKDLKDWHSEASKKLKDLAAALKKGDNLDEVFANAGDPFPEPPQSAIARLQSAADGNKDCQEADLNFAE